MTASEDSSVVFNILFFETWANGLKYPQCNRPMMHQEITFCSAKGALVIEQGLAHEQPEHSEQTELPSRGCSGCSDCSGCSVADNHPRNSLETEQPEHPSTRARAALGGGLWFGAQVAQGAHELTGAQNANPRSMK